VKKSYRLGEVDFQALHGVDLEVAGVWQYFVHNTIHCGSNQDYQYDVDDSLRPNPGDRDAVSDGDQAPSS
jgi:hypothetical protein